MNLSHKDLEKLCDYINYNAPRLHNLGNLNRAHLDIEYRLRHLGPDIVQSDIKEVINDPDSPLVIFVTVDKGIKGIPKYWIPNPYLKTFNTKLPTSHNEFIEYARETCSSILIWQIDTNKQGLLFSGLGNWRLAIIDISSEFKWPKWYLANSHEEWIKVKIINNIPIAYREDADNNIQEISLNTEFINNLL